jgi:hypothetical protein
MHQAMSVVDRRSRRYSTMSTVTVQPEVEKPTSTRAQPTESHRSRRVSTATTTVAPDNVPRVHVSSSERDSKSERPRSVSLCPKNPPQERSSRHSASMNKDLPSLPTSASDAPIPRPRSRPVDDGRRNSKAALRDSALLQVSIPEAVPRDSHGYSDVGKALERKTASYERPTSRPVSIYVTAPATQAEPRPNSVYTSDNSRLKAHSLPGRPSSPGDEPNKDRPRSPSLPVGSAPSEKRNSSALSPESSTDIAPRKRTTSSLGRLKQALPKLLLPTVSESEDICESPEISPWIELESDEYIENLPFADNDSERLSYIEFPQPPGMRIAQGHRSRVHPSRIEGVDSSRRRRSQSSIGGDSRDSRYSLYGS